MSLVGKVSKVAWLVRRTNMVLLVSSVQRCGGSFPRVIRILLNG